MILRIAGIDPSVRNTAIIWGAYDAELDNFTPEDFHLSQTVSNNSRGGVGKRDSLDVMIQTRAVKKYTRGCDLVFFEITTGGREKRSCATLGMSLGISGSAATAENEVIGVTPQKVKKAALGRNFGTKDEMIKWAMAKEPTLAWPMQKEKGEIIPVAGKCEHIADSLAVVYAGLQSDEFMDYLGGLVAAQGAS